MTPPRDTVLFVSAFPYLGGAQVSLATVLRHLPDDIHAVVAVPERGPFVDRVKAYRPDAELVVIPEITSGRTARDRVAIALVLAQWVVRNRRRLLAIHANGDTELTFVVPVLPLTRRPVFVWHHRADLAPTTTRLAPLWRFLRRRITWMAVSETRRRELLGAGIGDADNTTVVANPIDPADVVPVRREQHDGFVAGYLGCEYEAKGFTLLPDIARTLQGSGVTLRCVVKGLDLTTGAPALARTADELAAMPDVVAFRPRTFAVSEIYAEVDAVLIPSRAESFCRVAAEAMLNGLPVVATDLPALRELVDPGTGTLFPLDDAAAAAAALVALSGDPGRVRAMGDRGRARAAAFAPSRVATELVALYRSADRA